VLLATGLDPGSGTLTGSCGDDPGIACRLAWDVTHSSDVAQVVRVYLAGAVSEGLRILFVVVVALVVRAVAHRVINRLTERAATATLPVASAIRPALRGRRRMVDAAAPAGARAAANGASAGAAGAAANGASAGAAGAAANGASAGAAASANGAAAGAEVSAIEVAAAGTERREQRSRALGSILRSGVSIVVFAIAVLTILGDLGFNLTPLLLSTTVLGVALGFGAQNLVRDYLAGILMLVEDHYGVGDTINVKDATGTVEAMSLLTTRLRDVNGVVWHIRNGTIESVGNESQGWSRAVIDYPVPYEEDLTRIRTLMEQAAGSLFRERGWRKLMLEKPEVWGAQELSGREVTMRIVAKTAPMRQWEVARELRARVKAALDAAGVAPTGPDTIVITAPPTGPGAPAEAPPSPEEAPPGTPLLVAAEHAADSSDDPGEPAP
jgi:small-conductance mechanosensitive channel